MIITVGREVLGVLTGLQQLQHPGDNDVWWWRNDHVKDVKNAKKETTTKWEAPERQ